MKRKMFISAVLTGAILAFGGCGQVSQPVDAPSEVSSVQEDSVQQPESNEAVTDSSVSDEHSSDNTSELTEQLETSENLGDEEQNEDHFQFVKRGKNDDKLMYAFNIPKEYTVLRCQSSTAISGNYYFLLDKDGIGIQLTIDSYLRDSTSQIIGSEYEELKTVTTSIGKAKIYKKPSHVYERNSSHPDGQTSVFEKAVVDIDGSYYAVILDMIINHETDEYTEDYDGEIERIMETMFDESDDVQMLSLPELTDSHVAVDPDKYPDKDRMSYVLWNSDEYIFGFDSDEWKSVSNDTRMNSFTKNKMELNCTTDMGALWPYFSDGDQFRAEPGRSILLSKEEKEEFDTDFGKAKVFFCHMKKSNDKEFNREIALLKNNDRYVMFQINAGNDYQGLIKGLLAAE